MNCQNTFIWKDLREWRFLVEAVIPSQERQDLVQAIKQSPGLFEYKDNVDRFSEVYSQISDYSQIRKRLPIHMRSTFASIRMFHCCRPVNVQSYYEHGFRVIDSRQADDLFQKIFLGNPRFPEITTAYVAAAIKNVAGSYERHGYIYFGLDDRFLIECCGHYLIYGSEYLQTLAASLEDQVGHPTKSELRRIGIPTVFVVDMDMRWRTCTSLGANLC